MNQDELILVKFEEALTQAALSASTVVNYLADMRAFLRWGHRNNQQNFSLLQANQEHIRLYRYHLGQELNRAASTVNRHLMALRKFFTLATEWGLVNNDPTVGVALVQQEQLQSHKSQILSKQEGQKLLEAAQTGARAGLIRRDLAILQLLLYTGLRVNEVVDLQTADLIFDNPGVRLRVGSGQDASQTRYLPLSSELCKILTSYLRVRPQSGSENFFLNQEGRPLSKRTIQRIVSDCARAAGLDGISAQIIRRTFALQLLSETNDLSLVSKRLGHQSPSITQQYLSIHLNP